MSNECKNTTAFPVSLHSIFKSCITKMKLYILLVLNLSVINCHVRDWGMTSDLTRLKCTVRDVYREAFELLIAGREGVFPLPSFKQQYEQKWRNITEYAEFAAFNGWMKDSKIQIVKSSQHGTLRKYKMQQDEKKGPWHYAKEMIVCAECLEITNVNVNYFYEAIYNKRQVSGKIKNGPINYKISFQMTITNDYLADTQQYYCYTTTDAFDIGLDTTNNIFDSDIEGLKTLNFLADHIDDWMENHFNTTVRSNLKNQLQTAVAKIMLKHDICDEFLSA